MSQPPIGGDVFIDVETCSPVDLTKAGSKVYFEHPDTHVICLEAITPDGEIISWTEGEPPPKRLEELMLFGWTFWAHNVRFEQLAFEHILVPLYGFNMPDWWGCTMARARYNGLPPGLEHAAKALGLPIEKDMAGSRLMLTMARPRHYDKFGKPVWWHREAPEKLARLKRYCLQDCKVSMAVHARTRPLTEAMYDQYDMVQRMNARGVGIDLDFAKSAVDLANTTRAGIDDKLRQITRSMVPAATRVKQLKEWASMMFDVNITSLDKRDIGAWLEGDALPDPVREAISLRLEAAKSSVAKYKSMLARANQLGRVEDSHVWYGASTGRLSSQGLQTQNFVRDVLKGCDTAIDLIKRGKTELLQLTFGEPMEVLSKLLRPTLVPTEGRCFVGGDLSQIEARITAALARDARILKLFAEGKDVYAYTAAFMFGIAVTAVTEMQRQMGKVADLALGFGGGAGALHSMGRLYGITFSDAQAVKLVERWRETHEQHRAMWRAFERAAMRAVRNPRKPQQVDCGLDVDWAFDGRHLYMRLPSRRIITYRDVRIEMVDAPWGEKIEALTAAGVNSVTRRWERYLLTRIVQVENCVQGIAADTMFSGMWEADVSGYRPVLSVHDELVCEPPNELADECEVRLGWIMTQPIHWLPDVPLAVKTWRAQRYVKS